MFENVIGHTNQKQILETMINKKNISHAYLFSGNKGIGKCTLAKEFAKKILNVDNLQACPDFKYISKREDKKEIIVEQIRKDIIDNVYQAPAACEKKVYIIDDAETLNTAAQNALLKTLEEPPNYIVIILISSNISGFLSTIISRVNNISFDGITKEELNSYIINKFNITLDDDILSYIDGSIGTAIYIITNKLHDKFLKIKEIYNILKTKDFVKVESMLENVNFTEDNMLDYLEFLLFNDYYYNCVKYIERAKKRLKSNGNYDIVIDTMLLKIIDSM